MFPLNLLGFLRDWRVLAAIGLAALIGGLALSAKLANDRADKAQTRAQQAEVQSRSDTAGAHIEARHSTLNRQTIQTSEEGRRAVSQAPDLQSSVDAWRDAVVRLREQPRLTDPDPDGKRREGGS